MQPQLATLSDINQDLINAYQVLAKYPEEIFNQLCRFRIDSETYYEIRDSKNKSEDEVERAAQFIFLNQLCWNGLYRVNKQGRFNVPMGKQPKSALATLPTLDHLMSTSRILRQASILCCDFATSLTDATSDDLVFLDPPYFAGAADGSFVEYTTKSFDIADEIRLSKLATSLAFKGVKVLLTHNSHQIIRELYDGPFFKYRLRRSQTISGTLSGRRLTEELLITSFRLAPHEMLTDNLDLAL